MSESFKRYFQKEEEFLDKFPSVAAKASKFLGDKWRPDYDCDDGTRKNREYFFKNDELNYLVFDGAAVYHDEGKFSSVQIVLKSSSKNITIRVKKENGDLIAEKVGTKNKS